MENIVFKCNFDLQDICGGELSDGGITIQKIKNVIVSALYDYSITDVTSISNIFIFYLILICIYRILQFVQIQLYI